MNITYLNTVLLALAFIAFCIAFCRIFLLSKIDTWLEDRYERQQKILEIENLEKIIKEHEGWIVNTQFVQAKKPYLLLTIVSLDQRSDHFILPYEVLPLDKETSEKFLFKSIEFIADGNGAHKLNGGAP